MFKLIIPSAITAAATSSAVESPYATWAAGATYAKGAVLIHGRRLYESQKDNNTGNLPDAVVASSGTVWWVDLGPTNKAGMLDDELGTVTTATGSLVIAVTGACDAIALLNLKGVARIDIVVSRAGQALRSYAKAMRDDSARRTFKGWFFSPLVFRTEFVQFGLPTVYDGVTTITLTAPNAQAALSVGKFVAGRATEIGAELAEPTVGIQDNSTQTVDAFGRMKVIKRGYGKTYTVNCQLPTDRFDAVNKAMASVASIPVVSVCAEGRWDTLIAYGLVSFKTTLKTLKRSYCAIDVKGYVS